MFCTWDEHLSIWHGSSIHHSTQAFCWICLSPSKLGSFPCLAAVNVCGRNIGARQLRGIFHTSDPKKAARCLCPLVALEMQLFKHHQGLRSTRKVSWFRSSQNVFEEVSDEYAQGQKAWIKSRHILLGGEKWSWSMSSVGYNYNRITPCENIRMIQ